jgi:cell division protein FtsL
MMTRINAVLLLLVLFSAFTLVHFRYEARKLYTAVDRAQRQGRELEADHEALVAQKQATASTARVLQVATQQLGMRPADPSITIYAGAAQPAAPVTQETRP